MPLWDYIHDTGTLMLDNNLSKFGLKDVISDSDYKTQTFKNIQPWTNNAALAGTIITGAVLTGGLAGAGAIGATAGSSAASTAMTGKAIGAGITGMASMGSNINKQLTSEEKQNVTTTIRPKALQTNSSWGYAKNGLIGSKYAPVEVEGNELKIRKGTNGQFFIVQDYKGAKSHAEGGLDTVVQNGDIVIPSDQRNAVMSAIGSGNHTKVQSIVDSLPKLSANMEKGGDGFKPTSLLSGFLNPDYGTGEFIKTNNVDDEFEFNISSLGEFGKVKPLGYDRTIQPLPGKIVPTNNNLIDPDYGTGVMLTRPDDMPGYSPNNTKGNTNNNTWWGGLETSDKINYGVGGLGMIYAIGGLAQSYLRKPTRYSPAPTLGSPALSPNQTLANDTEPTLNAMKEDIQREGATEKQSMKEQGINPIVANSVVSSGMNKANTNAQAQVSTLRNQISQAQAQLNASINSGNASAINQWKVTLTNLQTQYNEWLSQMKAQDNMAISQERQGLWSMIMNVPIGISGQIEQRKLVNAQIKNRQLAPYYFNTNG